MDFLSEFLDFIKENDLFLAEERILLAVSGGKDSVFMTQLFSQANFNFGIAHCNFHLRGDESDLDEEFVKDLAKSLDVPFYKKDFDTKRIANDRQVSIQMAARQLRYEWFEEIRKEHCYNAIALAQHQTDSMETILLNLVRGTGISGLHGILPKRDYLIRPLLAFTSQEIVDNVNKVGLVYREDASNKETKYARNKIRLGVLPVLREINPALDATFSANSKRFHACEDFVETQMIEIRKTIFEERGDQVFHILRTSLQPYLNNDFLLFEIFRPFGFSEPVLHDLAKNIQLNTGKIFFSSTHQILVNREELILEKVHQELPKSSIISELPKELEWSGRKFRIHYSADTTLPKCEHIQKVDAGKVIFPITIRSWKIGDSFRPLGFKGRKKISDFLINRKVPLNEKKEVPIFVDGNGDIIWVAPWRMSDQFRITPETKKVIIFEQLL